VSAWATENRLVLGQAAVPDGSNEIGVIPDLLRTLDLSGAIVTIDAAGCQTENARLIRGQGGHYLLAVKDNQPTLRAAIERVFETACEADFVGVAVSGGEEVDDAHGRHEERYTTVVHDPAGIPAEWPDVAAVVQVNREREVGGERVTTTHYYLTSYAGSAAELGRWVRGHWVSRTASTGFWTWSSGRTGVASGKRTPGPTWRWSGGSPCRYSGGHRAKGAG
jgi:predicted transposase YbfD/YdcC